MKPIIIYITHPNLKTAKKIVAALLASRLIACGNIFPTQSIYWWNGKMKNSKEYVSIVKTVEKNWPKIKSAVSKIHPYQIPCIMKICVKANDDYESWINNEIK
ncbi:MAG: divalent-cation tolerance protein CutA [Patescibacteria group bacterium]